MECFMREGLKVALVVELACHTQECALLPERSIDPLSELIMQPLDVLPGPLPAARL